MNHRNKLIEIILKKLKLAHTKISYSEIKSFEDSLYQFSDEILETIVIVRLNELIKYPNLKR